MEAAKDRSLRAICCQALTPGTYRHRVQGQLVAKVNDDNSLLFNSTRRGAVEHLKGKRTWSLGA